MRVENKHRAEYKKIEIALSGFEDVLDYLIVPCALDADRYKSRALYINYPAETLNSLLGSAKLEKAEIDTNVIKVKESLKLAVTHAISFSRAGLLLRYKDGVGTVVVVSPANIEVVEDDGFGKLVFVKIIIDEKEQTYMTMRVENNSVIEEHFVREKLTHSNAYNTDKLLFSLIGATNNSVSVDSIIFKNIVDLSIGIMRNYADAEEINANLVPILHISALDTDYHNEEELDIRAAAAIFTKDGGKVEQVQASADSTHREAIKLKVEQLIGVGAAIIEETSNNNTATEAMIKEASKQSKLLSIISNTEEAFRDIFECHEALTRSKSSITLKKDISSNSAKLDLVEKLLPLFDRQLIDESYIKDIINA